MSADVTYDRYKSFVDCQLQTPKARHVDALRRPPAVTISRETGAGAMRIGERVADLLQRARPEQKVPWTVFDRNLVERVLEEHHLPSRVAQYMPEARISELQNMLEEVLGLHPDAWTLVRQSAETILHLAELGNVIIVGRGANVITARLTNVLHVRLVAPMEDRVKVASEYYQLEAGAARKYIEEQDRGRRGYVKKFFGRDIEEPSQYHMVLNTGLLGLDLSARLIAEAVLGREGA